MGLPETLHLDRSHFGLAITDLPLRGRPIVVPKADLPLRER
jgi:hypothetical protein